MPRKLGTVWFDVGFLTYPLGVVVTTLAMLNLASAPVDKPATEGVYRISRNPGHFGMFLILGGMGVACVSWVFLLLTLAFMISMHISVVSEERFAFRSMEMLIENT